MLVAEPGPWPGRLFFQPSLALIFFQLLPSDLLVGLVPGEKVRFVVGGVLGGVMGSNVAAEAVGESVLSSVRLSGPSVEDDADVPEMYVDSLAIELRPRVADLCDD